jgi:hypothetical protein
MLESDHSWRPSAICRDDRLQGPRAGSHLNASARSCRINNRKELQFSVQTETASHFICRSGGLLRSVANMRIRPPLRYILNRSAAHHKAGLRGRIGSSRRLGSRRIQAAASNRRNEPRIRALRPFGVMAGTWSFMVTSPSARRSSSTVRLERDSLASGSLATGARSAFSVSHWSGLRSKSLSSFMLPQGVMALRRCLRKMRESDATRMRRQFVCARNFS